MQRLQGSDRGNFGCADQKPKSKQSFSQKLKKLPQALLRKKEVPAPPNRLSEPPRLTSPGDSQDVAGPSTWSPSGAPVPHFPISGPVPTSLASAPPQYLVSPAAGPVRSAASWTSTNPVNWSPTVPTVPTVNAPVGMPSPEAGGPSVTGTSPTHPPANAAAHMDDRKREETHGGHVSPEADPTAILASSMPAVEAASGEINDHHHSIAEEQPNHLRPLSTAGSDQISLRARTTDGVSGGDDVLATPSSQSDAGGDLKDDRLFPWQLISYFARPAVSPSPMHAGYNCAKVSFV